MTERFDLLWRRDGGPIGELTREQLRQLYAFDPPANGQVRGSMVSSVDGSAAGPDGLSASISSPPDRVMLSLQRGLADVILVAAGTARAEGYRRTKAKPDFAAWRQEHGRAQAPTIAVVTSSGEVPDALLTPSDDEVGDLLVLVAEQTPADARDRLVERLGSDRVIVAGGDQVDPNRAVAALVERGLPRVVCEGGPGWLATVAATGRLDELCLTTSPHVVGGDAGRMLHGPVSGLTVSLEHLVLSNDTVFARWRISQDAL